jgi:hypothetical protein
MGKILIVVAAVVILTACGAVAYVALNHAGPATIKPDDTATPVATEPPVVPDSSVQAAAPAEPAALPPVVATAPDPVSTTSAAAAEKAPLTREQLAARVNNLSPDDYAKLEKAARERNRAKRMDGYKYALPSDRLLGSKKLNLTPDQEQQIKAIKDAMRPQMDQALGGVRAQYAQWETRGQALWNSVTLEGQSDPAFQAQIQAESDKYNEISKLQTAITTPLDQQYVNQVLQVLSPDQQQTFDAAAAAEAQALEQQKQRWNAAQGTGPGMGHTFSLNGKN